MHLWVLASANHIFKLIFTCQTYMRNHVPFHMEVKSPPLKGYIWHPCYGSDTKLMSHKFVGWIIPPSSHKINWETLMLMSTLVYFCLSKFELQGILIVLTSKLHGFHKSLGLQLFWETKIGEQFTDLLSYLFWPLWKSVYHTLQEKYISASMCKTYWDPFTLFCRSSKSDTYRYLSGIWQDLHLRMDIKEGYLMMSIEIGLSAQNISNTTLDSIVKTIGRVYMISFKE